MPSAPDPLHLLISQAAPSALPALRTLLARMKPAEVIEVDGDGPATPFEIALARAHRLPGAPGCVPWAAFESGMVGVPCAWLRPCHWQLGLDRVTLADPAALALTDEQSRTLLAAVQPLLAEDGMALTWVRPDAWLAQGEWLRGLITCSMQRALERPLTPDALARAPNAAQGAHLRRLLAELQMLLHRHPVNEARERDGRNPVNALWIDGAGALDAPHAPNPQVRIARAIDADSMDEWRRARDAGGPARLTLCGPRRARAFVCGTGLRHRITNFWGRRRLHDLIDQL